MTTAEQQELSKKIITGMEAHLNKDEDYARFTMDGIEFQRLPESKKFPAKLASIFNPILDGTAFPPKKAWYLWNDKKWKDLVRIVNEEDKKRTLFLKCMVKVNPNTPTRSTKTSDHTYGLD